MAHSLSAKKRIRQTEKRRARNRARKDLLKDQIKTFTATLASGNLDQAELELRKVTQRLDRVASKHTIHKNTAARKRSRLALKLNAVRSGAVKASAVVGGAKVRKSSATSSGAKA